MANYILAMILAITVIIIFLKNFQCFQNGKTERQIKEELKKMYFAAKKSEGMLFDTLKAQIEKKIEGENILSVLYTYKMVCENTKLTNFNISVAALLISLGGIIINYIQNIVDIANNNSLEGIGILCTILVILLIVSVITLHKIELCYKHVLFVVNDILKYNHVLCNSDKT